VIDGFVCPAIPLNNLDCAARIQVFSDAHFQPAPRHSKDSGASNQSFHDSCCGALGFETRYERSSQRSTTSLDLSGIGTSPARGTPRKWQENCLEIEGREVLLWDEAIEETCFAVSLRFATAPRQEVQAPALVPRPPRLEEPEPEHARRISISIFSKNTTKPEME